MSFKRFGVLAIMAGLVGVPAWSAPSGSVTPRRAYSRMARGPSSHRDLGRSGGRLRSTGGGKAGALFAGKTPLAGAGGMMRAADGSVFRLRDQVKQSRGVRSPDGRSIGPYACVPTATKMLLQARGAPTRRSVPQLYWRMHGPNPNDPGTTFGPNSNVARTLNQTLPPGRRAVAKGPGQAVDTRHPFVAALRSPSGGMGHAVLVTRVDSKGVTYADPGTGTPRRISLTQFRRRLDGTVEIR
jgi:hypothetical protein